MWAAGYLTHLPAARAPGAFVLLLLVVCQLGGGVAIGRLSNRGWIGGLLVGLTCGLLNLLILGSLLLHPDDARVVPSALIWIPGSIVLAGMVGAAGAALGERLRRRSSEVEPNWAAAFAVVAGVATLLLLSVGGVVTSYEAGLAVPDWPNSYGYNMFLYPLSRMSGGIYYEHAHRLFGSLVGLTTLVLAIYIQFVDARWWVRVLGGAALAAVIVQGVMGGLRVTGRLTLSASSEELAPNLGLAIVHGVFGQVFLALLAGLAVVLTREWRREGRPAVGGGLDRQLGALALASLLVQLVLGALHRHTGTTWSLLAHIMTALAVVVLVGAVAFRAWAVHADIPRLNRLGVLLLAALFAQFGLGFAALIVTSLEGAGEAGAVQVVVTTLHQTLGAALLAVCTAVVLQYVPSPRAWHQTRGLELAGES